MGVAAEQSQPLSVVQALNQAAVSTSAHKKLAKILAPRREHDTDALLVDLARGLNPALLKGARVPSVERALRFVVCFSTFPPSAPDDESAVDACCDFVERLLHLLISLSVAEDKVIRFRAMQLAAGIINGLSDEIDLSDELIETFTERALARLRDKHPPVRAQAVRSLARFQGFPEDGSPDEITKALQALLKGDRNKDVRKAVLSSIAVMDGTVDDIVERTRDISDEVRRTAYIVLAEKVDMNALSIAQRALILHRGLLDRSSGVKKACQNMLNRVWLDQTCSGNVFRLLEALDVEYNEDVVCSVVSSLYETGKASADILQSLAASAKGFRSSTIMTRTFRSEEALFWRVICESLSKAAVGKGQQAASAALGGAERVVAAEIAGEKLDLLESILPESAIDYIKLLEQHCEKSSFSFTTRQLIRLLRCIDLADLAARHMAIKLVEELLSQSYSYSPVRQTGAGTDVDLLSTGENSAFIRELHATHYYLSENPKDASDAIWQAVERCTSSFEESIASAEKQKNTDIWIVLHVLELVVCELEAIDRLESKQKLLKIQSLIQIYLFPAVGHINPLVRRVGIRALGLSLILIQNFASSDDSLESTETFKPWTIFKTIKLALDVEHPVVRAEAARALFDFVLVAHKDAVDSAVDCLLLDSDASSVDSSGDTGRGIVFILEELCKCLTSIVYGDDQTGHDLGSDEMSGGDGEGEVNELRFVVGEGLAKLLLFDKLPSAEESEKVLTSLAVLYFDESTQQATRLRQCLSVFFDVYAMSTSAHKKVICKAMVFKFFQQLVELPLRADSHPKAAVVDENGVCELAIDLVNEVEHLDNEGAQKTCINAIAKLIPILPYPYQMLQGCQDENSQVSYGDENSDKNIPTSSMDSPNSKSEVEYNSVRQEITEAVRHILEVPLAKPVRKELEDFVTMIEV